MRQPYLRGNHASQSGADLVAACLRGEEPAWEALIARYKGLIYKLALRMGLSPADASDVLQDVSLLLVDHLDELRDGSKVAHWLAITTKREVWSLARRRKPWVDISTVEHMLTSDDMESGCSERLTDPATVLLNAEDQFMVRQALMRLPPKCRALIECLYCEDPPLSYAATASRLGIPVNSVGPSRLRCLKTLKRLLIDQGF